METVIIYCSNCGNTKKYAEDLATRVGGSAYPLKRGWWLKAKKADTIVFGGWVMGNTIKGLNKFLSHYDKMKEKNVIIFSCGMSFASKEARELLIEQNILDMYHVRFYQLRGGFDASKLKFPYSFLMNNSLKMVQNDPNASPDQKALLGVKNVPIFFYDQEKIDRMTTVINSLSLVVEAKSEDK